MSAARVPSAVRTTSIVALGVALVHVVFGAIVRISGSGMGCGDHWPKCYGRWFPPLERMDLIIEVFHRYLAVLLLVSISAAVLTAWRHRQAIGVSGKGGVLRSLSLMLSVALFAAVFGAVTVKFHNAPWATVVHKLIAATTLAAGAIAVMRAGGLGASSTLQNTGTREAVGGATAAAVMALLVVILGGLTAKIPDAAIACAGFPLCGEGSLGGGAQHVQLTHRILAYLLVLHLVSLPFLFGKRGEATAVRRAAWTAMAFGLLQVVWAGWMVTGGFPGVARSLHQATGIAIWVSAVVMTYLARIASGRTVLPSTASDRVSGDERLRPLAGGARA
jgi:heme a synthase